LSRWPKNAACNRGLAYAGGVLVPFWSQAVKRRYHTPSGADDTVFVATDDGVQLAVKHFRPSAGTRLNLPPVVCLPGLGTDSANFDAPAPYGLARRFADAGLETFTVDLRGTGLSRMPWSSWLGVTFDDFVRQDVPAVMRHVMARTGSDRVSLVGHSLGGTLAYATLGSPLGKQVSSVVAIAAPLGFDNHFPLTTLVQRFGSLATVVPGFFGGTLGRLAVPLAFRVDVPVLRHWVILENVDGRVGRRLLYAAAQDVPGGLVRQLADWIANDAIRSVDHAVDYRDGLRGNGTPTLVVEAPLDGLAPPASVRRALSLLTRAEHFVANVCSGCAVDHGHIDVVFGRSAPRDVFPRLVGFLTSPATAPPDSATPHDFTRSA
jgi:pimeloyl-ACP methyl ester carboxylesterase